MSPGERALLRSARERRGYSVEQLAEAMDVRPRYLNALERGELEAELSLPYVRSIVARYALHVGLDPSAFLVGLEGADPRADPYGDAPDAWSRDGRSRGGRHLIIGSVAVAMLAAGFYAAMQVGVLPGVAGDRSVPTSSTVALVTSTTAVAATSTTVQVAATSTTAVAVTSTTLPSSVTSTATVDTAGGTDTPAGAAFLARFRPTGEVWMEVTDEADGETLFSGNRKVDDVLELRLDGPVLVAVGRPEAIKISIDRVKVKTPSAFRWRVTQQGAEGLD